VKWWGCILGNKLKWRMAWSNRPIVKREIGMPRSLHQLDFSSFLSEFSAGMKNDIRCRDIVVEKNNEE
jgi:hypothetical protein